MKTYRVTANGTTPADGYAVKSPSGKTYTVKYCGSGDGDPEYIAIWSCTCPANEYQKGPCKHIKAVLRAIEDDYGDPIELESGQQVTVALSK